MRSLCQTTSRAAVIALLATIPAAVVAQAQEETLESTPERVEADEEDVSGTIESDAGGVGETGAESVEGDAERREEAIETGAEEIRETTPETTETATGETAAERQQPAQPVAGQITMQDENSILASDLLGASVYSNNDETVGNIDDLIVNLDGSVEGIVIGVGGFLGLGEKQVAIQMSNLSVMQEEGGQPRLVSNANKADLEAAPEFETAEERQMEQGAAAPPEADASGAMDSGGTTSIDTSDSTTTEDGVEIEN